MTFPTFWTRWAFATPTGTMGAHTSTGVWNYLSMSGTPRYVRHAALGAGLRHSTLLEKCWRTYR